MNDLLPQHAKLLRESGIAPVVAAARGYRSVTCKAELKGLGFSERQCRVPALLIPIYNVHGEKTLYQIRPDDPRIVDGKPIKYETPRKARMVLDIPPGTAGRIGDPNIPLFVTEGVRKADSAVSQGLCCLALLGVWSFRGTNEHGGKTVLADWDSIALNGREVNIAFDSDADKNPHVRKALLRLKCFLESRGATVHVLRIPTTPDGRKVGLDDLFAAGHTVDELLATATQNGTARTDAAEEHSEHGRYGRPRILLEEGDLHALTLETWAAIGRANAPPNGPTIFRHGGTVARIERGEDGAERIGLLRLDTMRCELVRLIEFQKPGRNDTGETTSARPPADLVANLLASPDLPLPLLLRLVHVPVFDGEGGLVTSKGYHPRSGLYLPASRLEVPSVPDNPSPEEVKRARKLIVTELFGDFPFLRPADLANAVALLLLPFIRELIDGPTPLHLIEKPSPGTGAGLLTEVLAIPALGRSPAIMTEGRDEDEWRKRITAVLSRGPSFVVLDNVRSTLDSAALSAVLTATVWEDRLLGHSRTVSLPVRCAWIATGNNPAVSQEIARRSVPIRMDSGKEKPWERPPESFRHPNLRQWAVQNRGELVWAVLVLVRAWLAAGRPPDPKATVLGSYESYSTVLAGILAHAGIEGFLGNLSDFYDRADREGESWRGLISAWWLKYNDTEIGTADVWRLLDENDCNLPLGKGSEKAQKTKLGILLRQARDRRFQVLDGEAYLLVRLEHVGERQRAALYRLAPEVVGEHSELGEPSPPTPGAGSARETSEPGEHREPPPPPSDEGSERPSEPGEPPGQGFPTVVSEASTQTPRAEPGGKGSPGSPGSHRRQSDGRAREVFEV